MALSQSDRIAFSLNVVQAPVVAAQVATNKAAIQAQVTQVQALDTANMNLFTSPNALINLYQNEIQYIDGNIRTTIIEQDIQDAANKVSGNHFFPNNTAISVPSLASKNNVWTQLPPYALSYAIGKNYSEAYGVLANPEDTLITTILGYTDTTTVATIEATVMLYQATLTSMASAVPTTDTTSPNQAQNTAALNNINNVILPALATYLAASHPAPPPPAVPPATQTPNTPDPSFDVLKTAVLARQRFVATRVSQINAILGSITQDISTGNITASSGLYGKRYGILALRLHSLSGSLSQVAQLQMGINAQTALATSAQQNASTYSGFVPTSIFKADGNNLKTIQVMNPQLFSVGDTVYVYCETQTELLRAIASINNNTITLNDVVPSKYTVSNNARIYKDAT
jgi:hypothetical protein